MDKCWFVLNQTHYPPPDENNANGPLCLGHLIHDLRRLDHVLNPDGPLPLPRNMSIHRTKKFDLEWADQDNKELELGTHAGAPLLETAGMVSVSGHVGVAFQNSVQHHCAFAELETWIIQPTATYVEDSLKDEAVARSLPYMDRLLSRRQFMITGLMIARGAKGDKSATSGSKVQAGPAM
jgi:hypothetical protein